MNTAERLAISLGLCALGVLGCFALAKNLQASSKGITFSLCEEIAHELNNAFTEGFIDRETAVQVIDNCFDSLERQ